MVTFPIVPPRGVLAFVLLAFVLLAATAIGGAVAGQPRPSESASAVVVPRVVVRVGSGEAPAEVRSLPAQAAVRSDGAAGATDLRADVRCSATEPGVGIVVLSWVGPAGNDRPQRVDLTSVHRGFERQAMTSVWSLPPARYQRDPPVQLERTVSDLGGRSWVELRGLDPGGSDSWRVLTFAGDAWIASETARVEGPVCPVDYRRQTRQPGAR